MANQDFDDIMRMSLLELNTYAKNNDIDDSGDKSRLQTRILFELGIEPPPPVPVSVQKEFPPIKIEDTPYTVGVEMEEQFGRDNVTEALTTERIIGGGIKSPTHQKIGPPSSRENDLIVTSCWFFSAVLACFLMYNQGIDLQAAALSSVVITSFIPLIAVELSGANGIFRTRTIHSITFFPTLFLITAISLGIYQSEAQHWWGFMYSGWLALGLWLPLLFMQSEIVILGKLGLPVRWTLPRGTRMATSWPIVLLCILLAMVHLFPTYFDVLFLTTIAANLSLVAAFSLFVRAPMSRGWGSSNPFVFLLGVIGILLPFYPFLMLGGDIGELVPYHLVGIALLPGSAIIMSLIIGHLSASNPNNRRGPLVPAVLGFIFLMGSMFRPVMFQHMRGEYDSTLVIITAIIAILSWPMVEMSWIGMWSPERFTIDRVVSHSKKKSTKERSEMSISILGGKGSGKSTYLCSLWTVLRHNTTKSMWTGTAPFLQADQTDLPWDIDDVKRLSPNEKDVNDNTLLKNFLSARDYHFMLEDLIEAKKIPNLHQHPDHDHEGPTSGSSRFPFIVDPENVETRKLLDGFMRMITTRIDDPSKFLDSTQLVEVDIALRLAFPVNAHSEVGNLLFPIPLFSKRHHLGIPFRIGIHTTDFPGEDFQVSLHYFATKLDIFENARDLDDLKLQLVASMSADRDSEVLMQAGAEDRARLDIIKLHEDKASVRFNILDLIANSESIIYLIDADSATNMGGEGHDAATQEVLDFLRIAESVSHISGSKLESVVCLLNKSDVFLDHEFSRPTRRNITEIPASWESFKDTAIARRALDEITGGEDFDIEYFQCYFSSTLGGIIPVVCEKCEEMMGMCEHSTNCPNCKAKWGSCVHTDDGPWMRPPHPMVPVNVIEPLIRLILSTSHPRR